jgi:hypothetical protein
MCTMNCDYQKCSIKKRILKLQNNLNYFLSVQFTSLTDSRALNLSQSLDKLIVICIKCSISKK